MEKARLRISSGWLFGCVALFAGTACLVSLDGYELVEGDGGHAGNTGGAGAGAQADAGDDVAQAGGSGGEGGGDGQGGTGGDGDDASGGAGGEGGVGGAGGNGGSAGGGGNAGFEGGDCGGLDCDLIVPPATEPDCKNVGANCGTGKACRIATPTGGRCGPDSAPGCSTSGGACAAASGCCDGAACFRGQCTWFCVLGGYACGLSECRNVGHDKGGVCWPPI